MGPRNARSGTNCRKVHSTGTRTFGPRTDTHRPHPPRPANGWAARPQYASSEPTRPAFLSCWGTSHGGTPPRVESYPCPHSLGSAHASATHRVHSLIEPSTLGHRRPGHRPLGAEDLKIRHILWVGELIDHHPCTQNQSEFQPNAIQDRSEILHEIRSISESVMIPV